MDCIIRSLGYGVYQVSAPDPLSARAAMEQVGKVLEVWTDPEDPGSHAVAMVGGFQTSKMEASIATDPEVAPSVRRAASCSPSDSRVRFALAMVSDACSKLLGELYDPASLKA